MQFLGTMKKTIAYIDGFNLYYGLLHGNPSSRWLDPTTLVRMLLRDEHDVVAVNFFTARIRPYPYDAQAVARQDIYLQALAAQPLVHVGEGYYNRNKIWLPHVAQECRSCQKSREGMARVMKFEEKRSDVNLTSAFLADAFRNHADCYVLITGDSDYIAPIDIVRFELKQPVLVYNPRSDRPSDLMYHASYYAHIPRDLPARCQLPEVVPLPNGRTVHRPPAWA